MMVQIVIHSSKGKVLASPMACVDLEKSIPEESVLTAQNQELEGASDDGAQVIEAPSDSSESEKTD